MFGFSRKKKASSSAEQKGRQIPAPSSGLKNSLLSLEQRLMFDAAAAATASEVATEQVAQEQAEAAVSHDNAGADSQTADQAESQGVLDAIASYNPGEPRSEVVFVDPTVPNYQELLAGMDPHIEVVMLDGGTDGVHQMASALEGRTGLDAIHIISHGSAGELQLGTGTLSTESMSTQYAQDMATIQTALSEQADILVYGCDFAKGDAGQMAVDMLAEMTGADVEASTDLTGSISLGGDWDFEVKTGSIETSLAISYDAQMNWAEVLGKESVSDTFSAKSYGGNEGTRSWSSNWSEVDAGSSGANGGHIRVNSGQLRIDTDSAGESVSRGVDLSGATSAKLSFEYSNGMNKGGTVEARISTDGGAHYSTLSDGTFSKASHTGSGTASFDLSGSLSANTRIQFLVTGSAGGDRLTIDNVKVDYNVADTNKGDVKGQGEKGDAKGQTASESKAQTSTSDTKGQSDKSEAKGQSDKGDVKGQGEKGDTKDHGDKGDGKGHSDKGEAKGHGEKGEGKGHSDKGNMKGHSEQSNTSPPTNENSASTDSLTDVDPVVPEPVVGVAMDPVPVIDPVMPEPIVEVAVDPVPVVEPEPVVVAVDPVLPNPVVEPEPVVIAVDPVTPDPIVDPVMTEPVVGVAMDPVPVIDPVMPEPIVEVGVDPVPVVEPEAVVVAVDPVLPNPVVIAVDPVTPDPIVDPVMTEPVVGVVAGPDPVVVDPVVTEPVVEVVVGPDPVVLRPTTESISPEPGVHMAGPAPVVEVHKADVGATKTDSSGVEQTLVASLHQNASVGSETVSPLSASQSLFNNMNGDQVEVANDPGKSIDAQSESAATMGSTASSQTSSSAIQEGVAEQPALSGKEGNLSSASMTREGSSLNSDAVGTEDSARFAFGQFVWPTAEEAEKAPDGSGDLGMPMVAGLVGAALQGNMRKKEKLTTMRGESPSGEQKTGNEQTTQESSPDDSDAPPRAA